MTVMSRHWTSRFRVSEKEREREEVKKALFAAIGCNSGDIKKYTDSD